MDWEFAKLAVTVAIAMAGWLVTFLLAERSRAKSREREVEQTKENATKERMQTELEWRIARIDRQIQNLYGPMYAQLQVSNSAWERFWEIHRPSHGENAYFVEGIQNSEEELKIWRVWIENVFHPSNSAIAKAIVANAHLIDGRKQFKADNHETYETNPAFPREFRDFLAHVHTYDAVIAR